MCGVGLTDCAWLLLACSNADNNGSALTKMMEKIKRRMIAVNSLEVMRRTFKVGLVLSEDTEAELEYDLGMSDL